MKEKKKNIKQLVADLSLDKYIRKSGKMLWDAQSNKIDNGVRIYIEGARYIGNNKE